MKGRIFISIILMGLVFSFATAIADEVVPSQNNPPSYSRTHEFLLGQPRSFRLHRAKNFPRSPLKR